MTELHAGVQRPHTQIADWMATAIQALSQKSDRYTYIVTNKSTSKVIRVRSGAFELKFLSTQPDLLLMQVRWEYFQKVPGFEGNLAGQIDLEHQSDAASVVQHLLHTALNNLASLQV